MRLLITGITGFVGSHLAEYLLSHENIDIFGTVRHRSPLENISHIKDKLTLIHDVDLRDAHAIKSAIEVAAPDYIFHLAAQSFVPASWVSPADTINTNVMGTVNLLEAVRRSELNTITLIIGSSEEYGCPPLIDYDDEGDSDTSKHFRIGVNQTPEKVFKLPITEDFPLLPLSPYGVSKVAEDLLGFQYHKSYGMKIVRTRAFNHSGARRGEAFVTSSFAKQIAEIEKGKREPILSVGDLEAKRDFTDVRDIVRGYWLAATKGKYGEVYNLCSGKARSIYTVLDTLRLNSTAQFEVVQDKSRLRPSDIPILQGSYTRFRKRTGWRPGIGFSQTMGDLLDYWRGRV